MANPFHLHNCGNYVDFCEFELLVALLLGSCLKANTNYINRL
jgi:hypothetical protein